MRRWSALIVLLAVQIMLTACMQTQEGSTEINSAPAAENEPIVLNVTAWDVEAQGFADIVMAFQEKHPNIKVRLKQTASAGYTQELNVSLNGGTEIDVFWVKDADTLWDLFNRGYLLDLQPYIQKDNWDLSAYKGLVDNCTLEEEIVGLPARIDYYVLFYNKDIFSANNIPFPQNDMTWQQFEQTAKQLTSGEGINKNYGALLYTWQACVQNWGVQSGEHTILDTDYAFFQPYYEMALRMQNDDESIPDFLSMQLSGTHYSELFLEGKIGMMPMGTWFMSTILSSIRKGESDINWGVSALPHAEGCETGMTVGAATPICINASSRNKEQAWEFLKFAAGEEGAAVLAQNGLLSGYASDCALQKISELEDMPEGIKEALAVQKIYPDRPVAEHVVEVNQMLGNIHKQIMLGEVSVEEGLQEMSQRSTAIQQK